ncbi:MAG: class I SAM-dependent methyltransferase [Acidobacteriota bacterium]
MIRSEVSRCGPISFSRFQELALYHPVHGYYTTGAGIGRDGADFWTAPEMTPAFGGFIGVQIEEMAHLLDSPPEFRVIEYGAGEGGLAVGLLDSWRARQSRLYRPGVYEIVEQSPVLRQKQHERLAAHRGIVEWGMSGSGTVPSSARASPPPLGGVILMNEVLDALPVRRVVQRGSRLAEICVGVRDGDLIEVQVDATADLEAELCRALPAGHSLAPGQEAEIRVGVAGFMASACDRIESGYVIVIDYGMCANDLYDHSRVRGTAMAYSSHVATEDLLARVGCQDITAHVDFTALSATCRALHVEKVGMTTQMEFLLSLGIGEAIEKLAAIEPQSPAVIGERRDLVSLIQPGGMGTSFKVWIGARAAPHAVRGMSRPPTGAGRP